jgi:UDPglucose--hexose-1-phosphate uridylyltransferase
MRDVTPAAGEVVAAVPTEFVTLGDVASVPATHIRRDPIFERYVIIAPQRALRPNEFTAHQRDGVGSEIRELEVAAKNRPTANLTPNPLGATYHSSCPFCEGHEHLATHETMALRAAGTAVDTPGWRVRAIANKFPAAVPHEVIVESPRHLSSVSQLSVEQMAEVLSVYQHRLAALGQLPGVRYVHLFKNAGAEAGASLEHLHSQIIGLSMVPPSVQAELRAANDFAASHGTCIFCDLLARELAAGQRIIAQTSHFVAVAAFAGRFPLETWILPRQHAPRFEQMPAAHQRQLAQLLINCIEKIEQSGSNLAYNYLVHTAPFDTTDITHYHWHIEILPRTTTTAGFEWGTGMFINPVPPEQAAKMLRFD